MQWARAERQSSLIVIAGAHTDRRTAYSGSDDAAPARAADDDGLPFNLRPDPAPTDA